MNDRQGEFIDGTARAPQWRRARSKPRPATDGGKTRSDAPKSIAGSLLVPADMLPPVLPTDGHVNGNEQSAATERPLRHQATVTDRASHGETPHQNPFLVPEAAARTEAGTRSPWRQLPAALVARAAGAISARGTVSWVARSLVATRRPRLAGVRRARPVALTLAAAAITLATVIITQSEPTRSPVAKGVRTASSLGALTPYESGFVGAAASPFGQRRSGREHASKAPRRAPARRARNRPRTRPARKAVAVTARYTPPAAAPPSSTAASDTPSYAGSSSTAAPTQPATSAGGGGATSSASSTPSRPAFGQNGILGPGHSPNS